MITAYEVSKNPGAVQSGLFPLARKATHGLA